jgi:ABC-type dipeptide/oligopeptide/nickel transport system permease component
MARILGMAAWMVFATGFLISAGPDLLTRMVVFCVITILVFTRLRIVPTDPKTLQIPLEARTPEGRAAFLGRRLRADLGIQSNGALSTESFRKVHTIAPGRLASFLDDLHCDFGFHISGDDADRVDSETELLSLIDQRHPYASSVTEEATT